MKTETTYDADGQIVYKVTHPKFKHSFEVHKSNDSFVFYSIVATKGAVAKELQGRFTSPKLALTALDRYLQRSKESVTARRDRVYKENHATKPKSDDQEHIQ